MHESELTMRAPVATECPWTGKQADACSPFEMPVKFIPWLWKLSLPRRWMNLVLHLDWTGLDWTAQPPKSASAHAKPFLCAGAIPLQTRAKKKPCSQLLNLSWCCSLCRRPPPPPPWSTAARLQPSDFRIPGLRPASFQWPVIPVVLCMCSENSCCE